MHHIAAKTPSKILQSLKNLGQKITKAVKKCRAKKTQKVANGDVSTSNKIVEPLEPNESIDKVEYKRSSGRVGLKFGVKSIKRKTNLF